MKINGCLLAAIVIFVILLVIVSCDMLGVKSKSKVSPSKTEGFDGVITGSYGTFAGDGVGEYDLYLDKYDTLAEGIDPEVQISQDEYVREQDNVIVSRGAAGAHATETDHYTPPNTPHGLTGFRNFYHQTYTLPDARQMPSDDPDQYYSHNPSAYAFGALY